MFIQYAVVMSYFTCSSSDILFKLYCINPHGKHLTHTNIRHSSQGPIPVMRLVLFSKAIALGIRHIPKTYRVHVV